MDAEYLKANVGEVLANGLTAVVLNQPEDSVDYLARWLLKYVDNTKAEEELKLQLAKQAEIDKKADEVAEAARLAEEKATAEKTTTEAQRKKDLEEFLASAATFDGLYSGFVQHLKDITGVTGCYMGLKEKGVIPAEVPAQEEGDEGDAPPASDLSLQYIAASDNHKFLVGQRLKGTQGVSFNVFNDAPAAGAGAGGDEEEGGDEGDAADKKVEEVDTGPKSIVIQNVLMGEGSKNVHFWQLPKLGSYMTVRLNYEACLNETTLDEAIEKEAQLLEQKAAEEEAAAASAGGGDEGDAAAGEEAPADEGDEAEKKENEGEGEEKKEEEPEKEETEAEREVREKAEAEAKEAAEELYLVSHLPKTPLDYCICLDTLGLGRRFSEEDVAYVKSMVSLLNETALRIDRTLFKEERARRAALAQYNESVEEKTEEEQTQELERLKGTLERAGASSTTEADVTFKYRQNSVMALREKYEEFRRFNVFRGPLAIMQALFFMLDYEKTSISDLDGKPDWNKIRQKLDEEFFNKLTTYDPREPQLRNKATQHATVANLRKMVAGFNMDDIKAKNQPLSELLGFIRDALAVKSQARKERKEAKAAAEAEARALAEQQQAEAAAAEAEGDEAAAEGEKKEEEAA